MLPISGWKGTPGKALAHFARRGRRGRFGDFEADDGGGVEAGDLAAEFGADGAGGAGDEDDLAFEPGAMADWSRRTGLRPRRSSTATSRI